MPPERVLDFGGLDAIAAQLDLEIPAPEEFDDAGFEPAPRVAGPIQALAAPEGIGHVALGGEIRGVQVAAAESVAADIDLSAHADRHELERLVQDVHARVGDGAADLSGLRPVSHAADRGPDGRLRWTVAIPELDAALDERRRQILGQALSARPRAEPRRRMPVALDQQTPRRGRGLHHGDPVTLDQARQVHAAGRRRAIDDDHARAGHEREKHFERRDVERPRGHRGHDVGRGHAWRAPHAGQDIGERAVGNGDAFRRSGGARRVDRVGELRRRDRRERNGAVVARRVRHGDRRRAFEARKVWPGLAIHEHQPGAAVVQDVSEAPRRVRRVHRQIHGPGLQNAEQADDHVFRPLHQERHDLAARDAVALDERPRHGVGAPIELLIRERASAAGDRRSIRDARDLRGEERDDAPRRRAGVSRRTELLEQTPPLGAVEYRQRPEARIGTNEGGTEQRAEASGQSRGGGPIEERRRVVQVEAQATARGAEVEREVVLADPLPEVERLDPRLLERQRHVVDVLERDHHVEERRAAQIAVERELVHQPVEGIDLMLDGADHQRPDVLQVAVERHVGPRLAAQRQRVDEETNLIVERRMDAPRHRAPHRDVVLPGHPHEQHVDRRQQAGKDARAARRGETRERGPRVPPEVDRDAIAREALRGGTRAVERQLQRERRRLELPAPELARRRDPRAREQRLLPRRVVLVLTRERRAALGHPASRIRISPRELGHHERDRPAVADHVVHDDDEAVEIGGQPAQHHAQRGRLVQGEAPVHPSLRLALEAASRIRVARPVVVVDHEGARRQHLLARLAVHLDEPRAQHLVPRDQAREGPGEGAPIERAAHQEGGRHVVGRRTVPGQLLDDPQAALRVRQLVGGLLGHGGERQPPDRIARGHQIGELRDRGPSEDVGEPEVDRVLLMSERDDAGGLEALAAQREEVVVHADAIEPQDLLPDGDERRFEVVARRPRLGGASQAARLGNGQAPAIDLAVGRQRERLDAHEHGRHHVLGELPREMRPQIRDADRRRIGDEVGDQLARLPRVAGDDERVADLRVRAERALDLRELDAEAAHLDLAVAAAQVHDVAVGAPQREITGAIEPPAGRSAERIGHEALGGQAGLSDVAARQAAAADEQFARHADADRLEPAVEDVERLAAEPRADRHAPRVLGAIRPRVEREERRRHRRLGGTVGVDERDAGREVLAPELHALGGERFPADEHRPHRAERAGVPALHPRADRFVPVGRRQLDDRDPMTLEDVSQLVGRPQIGAAHDERRTRGQRGENLLERLIERDVVVLKQSIPGHEALDVAEPPGVKGQRAVIDHHALGLSRGARRVDHVRQVAGVDARVRRGGGRRGAGERRQVDDVIPIRRQTVADARRRSRPRARRSPPACGGSGPQAGSDRSAERRRRPSGCRGAPRSSARCAAR